MALGRAGIAARLAIAAAAGAGAAYIASRPTLVPWPAKVRPAFIGLVGTKGAGLAWLAAGAVGVRGGPGPSLTRRAVRSAAVAAAVTGAVVGANAALPRVSRRLEGGGRTLDEGFSEPPADPHVSGSPASLVAHDTLGREGARLVGDVVPAQTIEYVTGKPAHRGGVRVFVGIDSADSVEERVELAIAELHRTGGFDRAHLLVESPAGSGYANPNPVDILEILSLGDSAVVVVGYGLLPSFLSLDRVELAARTQKLLLDRIREELSGRDRRPRLLLYGESLGARVQQAAIPGGSVDLDAYGVDGALWVGTPGGRASVAFHEAVAGESITIDRPEQIPDPLPQPRPRVWFLEHDGDPVVRFEPSISRRRPGWLAQRPRGRNVPEGMVWFPGITWAQVLVDTVFATNIRPGKFESRGHDYRADLGGTVPLALGFDVDEGVSSRLEETLREREIARAQRLGEA